MYRKYTIVFKKVVNSFDSPCIISPSYWQIILSEFGDHNTIGERVNESRPERQEAISPKKQPGDPAVESSQMTQAAEITPATKKTPATRKKRANIELPANPESPRNTESPGNTKSPRITDSPSNTESPRSIESENVSDCDACDGGMGLKFSREPNFSTPEKEDRMAMAVSANSWHVP